MISAATINTILLLLGVLVGVYFPATILYAYVKWKTHPSFLSALWSLLKKIILVAIGFLLLMAGIGFIMVEVLALQSQLPEENAMWLGLGLLGGLVVGLWLVLWLVRRMMGQRRASQT